MGWNKLFCFRKRAPKKFRIPPCLTHSLASPFVLSRHYHRFMRHFIPKQFKHHCYGLVARCSFQEDTYYRSTRSETKLSFRRKVPRESRKLERTNGKVAGKTNPDVNVKYGPHFNRATRRASEQRSMAKYFRSVPRS